MKTQPFILREQIKLLDAYLKTEDCPTLRIRIMREVVRLAQLLEEKEKGAPWITVEYHLPSAIQPCPIAAIEVVEPLLVAV